MSSMYQDVIPVDTAYGDNKRKHACSHEGGRHSAAVWPETAKRIDIIAFTSALPRRIQRFSKLLHSVPQLLYF